MSVALCGLKSPVVTIQLCVVCECMKLLLLWVLASRALQWPEGLHVY
jgi:hypothetical protein